MPTENKTHYMPTFRYIHTRFQVYRPCPHVAHQNTRVNGANFVVNSHEARVNTLES